MSISGESIIGGESPSPVVDFTVGWSVLFAHARPPPEGYLVPFQPISSNPLILLAEIFAISSAKDRFVVNLNAEIECGICAAQSI
jgi:hypothetical protein